jgi:hypothetical protein
VWRRHSPVVSKSITFLGSKLIRKVVVRKDSSQNLEAYMHVHARQVQVPQCDDVYPQLRHFVDGHGD